MLVGGDARDASRRKAPHPKDIRFAAYAANSNRIRREVCVGVVTPGHSVGLSSANTAAKKGRTPHMVFATSVTSDTGQQGQERA